MDNQNGWAEHSKLVLTRIDELNGHVEDLFSKIEEMRVQSATNVERVKGEIRLLHFKAGLVGLIGGSIPVVIALVVLLVRHYI